VRLFDAKIATFLCSYDKDMAYESLTSMREATDSMLFWFNIIYGCVCICMIFVQQAWIKRVVRRFKKYLADLREYGKHFLSRATFPVVLDKYYQRLSSIVELKPPSYDSTDKLSQAFVRVLRKFFAAERQKLGEIVKYESFDTWSRPLDKFIYPEYGSTVGMVKWYPREIVPKVCLPSNLDVMLDDITDKYFRS
jgi:hypothetical protein